MLRRTLLLLVLLGAGGWPEPSTAHGKERPFGTPINDRSPARASESGGAPGFALLALSVNLNGIERDLGAGRTSDLRERAQRLPRQARDLVARSQHLDEFAREQVARAGHAITESARRIDSAATSLESASVLREVDRVRRQIAELEALVRTSED